MAYAEERELIGDGGEKKIVVREAYLASQETRLSGNDERGETNDEPSGKPATHREMLDCKTRPQLIGGTIDWAGSFMAMPSPLR